MEFNANLKRIRKSYGLTQMNLADRAGLTLRTIQRFESGDANPTMESVESLAKALNIDKSELLGIKDPISIMIDTLITENSYTPLGGKTLLPIYKQLFPEIEIPKHSSEREALEYGLYEAIAQFIKLSTRVLTTDAMNNYMRAFRPDELQDEVPLRDHFFKEYRYDLSKAEQILDRLAEFSFQMNLLAIKHFDSHLQPKSKGDKG